MPDTDTSPTPQSDVNQPDSRSTEGQNVHRWSISEMPRGLYDTSTSPIELEEILANYIMPAHMHNGIDKRAEAKAAIQAIIAKAEAKARIEELQQLIGTHNNDPSVNDYDVIRVTRQLLNERITELSTSNGGKRHE